MKFALIGYGAIGSALTDAIYDLDTIEKIYIVEHHREKVERDIKEKIEFVTDYPLILEEVDFVVEAASQEAVRELIPLALEMGRDAVIMSVGALADDGFREKIIALSRDNDCHVHFPSGAVCGLDGLAAGSQERIDEIEIVTRKPPKGLMDNPYIQKEGIDLDELTTETVVFDGKARDAIASFPKNINVAAAIGLVAGDFSKVNVKIIADPTLTTNIHVIKAKGTFGEIECRTSNLPFKGNAKTSYLAALSAIYVVKKLIGQYSVRLL